ncbi:hypothetical protein RJC98_16650 [Pseudomonas allii]|uniref:Uncharacterized protein n=2 Tax=Pseudomonas allii TaxID=2740531 RepID=A0ACC6LEL8_9PSED|nr:hypothetical protein [Pseudomonas allii]KTB69254.1 hypothetical protein AO066_20215 [Pseudomonas fluorescens]MDR9876817.1 hypothetical protein [Pseudomonas allii]NWN48417.1 hypothetical protein [Pseudomonas allii]NWN63261.1 hypothetical protein [Pseudomonas allii]RMP85796.1 hypothetical protein ALQ17_04341 [Pseudomonas fluorescens]
MPIAPNSPGIGANYGGVDNEQAKAIQDQLQREKNAQNIKQTVDSMLLDYSTKVMQQIGAARA